MPKLVAPAEIVVWGWGSDTSPSIAIRCKPMGGGAWLEIMSKGSYRQPESMRGNRAENLMFDEDELEGFLAALADPDFSAREPPPFTPGLSAIGCVQLKLSFGTGMIQLSIDESHPHRLVALADLLLSIAERAGLIVDAGFHPLNSR